MMSEGQGLLGSRRSAPRDTHIINLLDQLIIVWRFDCMEVMVGLVIIVDDRPTVIGVILSVVKLTGTFR